jgi:hypothetical protein
VLFLLVQLLAWLVLLLNSKEIGSPKNPAMVGTIILKEALFNVSG